MIKPAMSEDIKSAIRDTYHGYIKNLPEFVEVFLARSEKDMRKYQEFTNLCRAFARLDGSRVVDDAHIAEAMDIMLVSLRTLHENFPLDELEAGMSGEDLRLFEAIKDIIKDNERLDLKTLRGAMVGKRITDADLRKLEKGGYLRREANPDGSDYIVLTH
jgi:DNA replicative helicase MCM subunit Mcm2 (Cdc46/Mcm family)